MIGFVRSARMRTPACLAAATTLACVVLPAIAAPTATAADAPTMTLELSRSALGSADTFGTGCAVTVTATLLRRDNGAPVPSGAVIFFNRVPGNGDVLIGDVPVVDGKAVVQWTPTTPGDNGISAGYRDGPPDLWATATGTRATVVPLGGLCV